MVFAGISSFLYKLKINQLECLLISIKHLNFASVKIMINAPLKMKAVRRIILFMLIASFVFALNSCSHRSGHVRNSDKMSSVQHDGVRHDNDGYASHKFNNRSEYSSSEIIRIASGNDCDAMLDCLQHQVEEISSLRKAYLKGNLTDNVAQQKLEEITSKYQPISDRLDELSSKGKLTYNQHKKQMKYVKSIMTEISKFIEQVESDLTKI